jgi:hypothetical protein
LQNTELPKQLNKYKKTGKSYIKNHLIGFSERIAEWMMFPV